MAALDFPNNPVNGQTYVAPGGQIYTFNGVAWMVGGGQTVTTWNTRSGDVVMTYDDITQATLADPLATDAELAAAVAGLGGDVSTKADKTYVDSQDAALNAAINTKASTADVDAANAAQDAVTALKVDKTGDTGAAKVPVGTTAQQPGSPLAGYLRFNTETGKFEGHNGTVWGAIGGGAAISLIPPTNPGPGDFWWSSDLGLLFVYYNDGNTAQWVSTAPAVDTTQFYTKAAADTKFVDAAGDTMTGGLTAPILAAEANFKMQMSGPNPLLIYDVNSYAYYDRGSNGYKWVVANTQVASLTNSGTLEILNRMRSLSTTCRAGEQNAWLGNGFNISWSPANLYIDSTLVGTITTSSDYRIKKDVVDLPSTWNITKTLRPISYSHIDYTPPSAEAQATETGVPFIVGDDIERWGFIAHELQDALVPSAAVGEKDDPGAIQSPNPWTLLAAVTRTLQEAQARIEALEAAAELPVNTVQTAINTAFALPAGGLWFWWAAQVNNAGALQGNVLSGVDPGGASILPAVAARRWVGFARRIG